MLTSRSTSGTPTHHAAQPPLAPNTTQPLSRRSTFSTATAKKFFSFKRSNSSLSQHQHQPASKPQHQLPTSASISSITSVSHGDIADLTPTASRSTSIAFSKPLHPQFDDQSDIGTSLNEETDIATVIERNSDLASQYGGSMAGESYVFGHEQGSEEDMERLVSFLTEVDYGFHMLLDRVKQNMHSSKELAGFVKKRAAIEEEYGKSLLKLAQSCTDTVDKGDGKQGTYGESWTHTLKVHTTIAQNHLRFSRTLSELSESLSTATKNTERSRRQLKDAGMKHLKQVTDAETSLEKSKTRYETFSEDWERAILSREQFITGDGFSHSTSKFRPGLIAKRSGPMGLVFWQQSNSVQKLDKMEDDARKKAALANEQYRVQLLTTSNLKEEFLSKHLPRILRSLKETNDEADQGLKYHLNKYAFDYENAMMVDATSLSPLDDKEMGLRKIASCINDARDFNDYLTAYVPKRPNYANSVYGFTPETYPFVESKPTFGMDLADQLTRDDIDIPPVVRKCASLIEEFGIRSVGLYRLPGNTHLVNKLRNNLNKDHELVDLRSEEWVSDVNTLTGVMKLFFRELPDPLFPKEMYLDFIEASKIADDRTRIITIHDLINKLPDANYATLKFLMSHLNRVQQNQQFNRMGISNLAIVWGPTLMGGGDQSDPVADLQWQCKVVEIVLTNFYVIFDDE